MLSLSHTSTHHTQCKCGLWLWRLHCPWRVLRVTVIPCAKAITKKYFSVLKGYCMNWYYVFSSPGQKIVAVVASLCWEFLSIADRKNKFPWAGTAPGYVLTREDVIEDCCQQLSPCFTLSYRMRRVARGNLHLSEVTGKPLDTVSVCRRQLPTLFPRMAWLPSCNLLNPPKLNPSLSSTPSFISLHPSAASLFQVYPHKLST